MLNVKNSLCLPCDNYFHSPDWPKLRRITKHLSNLGYLCTFHAGFIHVQPLKTNDKA